MAGANGGVARYNLTVEPSTAFLARRRDSRIFQDMTVFDVLDTLFAAYQGQGKLTPAWRFDILDRAVYPKRSITTQYQESDLAFAKRLMHEEGPASPLAPGPGKNVKNRHRHIMEKTDFSAKRRQIYLDEESYINTVKQIELENAIPTVLGLSQEDLCTNFSLNAQDHWIIFQLKFTAGESLTELANSLDEIVLAYEQYVDAVDELPDDKYYPPFIMNDLIDTYVDYLNLLCAAILLRREDLIARICALNEGTDFDQSDAVLGELFKFFLADRPDLDYWLWDKPYRKLLDAIDSDTPEEMASEMKLYVKNWYKDMKGVAHFWGKHEKIVPEYTSYLGYWAMCAAAFTYLYNIDDATYRNETVYPKDLVDYARSIPRSEDTQQTMTKPLRAAGGETCPKSGVWFSPAKADSQAHFSAGTIMPDFPDAQYGLTIWQWIGP